MGDSGREGLVLASGEFGRRLWARELLGQCASLIERQRFHRHRLGCSATLAVTGSESTEPRSSQRRTGSFPPFAHRPCRAVPGRHRRKAARSAGGSAHRQSRRARCLRVANHPDRRSASAARDHRRRGWCRRGLLTSGRPLPSGRRMIICLCIIWAIRYGGYLGKNSRRTA